MLPVALNAVVAPVDRFMPPSKRTVPPVLVLMSMPPPVDVMLPLKSTVPVVRPVTSTTSLAAVASLIVAPMVTLPVPPLMSTPMPPGSLVLPIEPPLIVMLAGAELVMSMPSPAMPLS